MHTAARSTLALALFAALGAGCDHEGTYTCMAFAGRLGEPCVEGVCVEGAACADDGTCQPPVGAGEPCDATRPCEWLLACEAGTCVGTRALEGERCMPGAPGACAEGLGCDASPDVAGLCVPLVAEGELCSGDGACPSGLLCVRGRCGAPPLEGASCSSDGACAEGLECGVWPDDVCIPIATAEGDLCGGTCPEGLDCYRLEHSLEPGADNSFRCRPLAGEGEACNISTAPCEAGLECRAERCIRPGEVGEACDVTRPCAAGLACDGGACAAPRPIGASCRDEPRTCGEGAYCDTDRGRWDWDRDII